MDIFSAAVMLFLVMDPLGNIPIFLTLLKDFNEKQQRKIIIREQLIAFVILLIFLFLGEYLLDFLSLRQETISISGGLVLFLIAIRMIFPPPHGGVMGEQLEGEPFVVPLAIPLVAGPSSLATLLLLVRSDAIDLTNLFFALSGAWAVSAIILFFATTFYKVLRKKGLIAMEKLMGMLLVMVSVQMFLDGVSKYLQG
ncbi:MAG: hypothetical protein COB67_11280 [SAR324 cluster bacterium]|uniref:UPF0056 membrane protein n=1 Tax=SAR324 cluster bacterium TaxID=2024889 RepID=A0A2A4SVN1_9DELT|nr:MAG: hypothetical protein COB67_11280 [SAR324 cluster bacterium]